MTDQDQKTEKAPGFVLDLRDGVELRAQHIQGQEKPWLGIRHGDTFIALAEFLSDDELEFLSGVMKSRAFIIAPLEDVARNVDD